MLRNIKKSMTKSNRVAPYKQKGRRSKKDMNKTSEIEDIKVHTAKKIAKFQLMSEEEFALIKSTTARNALNLLNNMIEEMQRRLPQMSDEVVQNSLLSVWDKLDKSVDGKK